jgi:hypothetical protein
MNWVEIVVSILSGLTVCIPLVVKLVNVVGTAIKEKNWSQLTNMAFQYMAEAEKKFTDGASKKEWVMGMMEVAASTVNYDYNDEAKEKISAFIDNACAMSKKVNAEE